MNWRPAPHTSSTVSITSLRAPAPVSVPPPSSQPTHVASLCNALSHRCPAHVVRVRAVPVIAHVERHDLPAGRDLAAHTCSLQCDTKQLPRRQPGTHVHTSGARDIVPRLVRLPSKPCRNTTGSCLLCHSARATVNRATHHHHHHSTRRQGRGWRRSRARVLQQNCTLTLLRPRPRDGESSTGTCA